MRQIRERTMADVIERLRRTSPEATIEVMELYLAVREVSVNSRQLEAALKEVAAEAAALAASPGGASTERLNNLAAFTAILRTAAEGEATVLSDLRKGIEAWGFASPCPE